MWEVMRDGADGSVAVDWKGVNAITPPPSIPMDAAYAMAERAVGRLCSGQAVDLWGVCLHPDGRMLGWTDAIREINDLSGEVRRLLGIEDTMPGLRAIRKAAGLSQAEVGKAAGLSRVLYNEIECGRRRATVPSADAIAHALGCAPTAIAFPIPPR